jgi:hypothetical protein
MVRGVVVLEGGRKMEERNNCVEGEAEMEKSLERNRRGNATGMLHRHCQKMRKASWSLWMVNVNIKLYGFT